MAPKREEKPGCLRERKGRPGVWEVIVPTPRDPVTGRRGQVSRIVHGDRKAADAKRDELLDEVRAGKHGDAELTVKALLDSWLASVRDELSPTTYNEYRRLSRNLIGPSDIGRAPLAKVTAATLTEFYKALRRSGRAAASVRKVHAVLRGALGYAVLARWIDENPTSAAKVPRSLDGQGGGRRRAATRDQVTAILSHAAVVNRELYAFLSMSVASAARRGELCGLRRSDVDLEARTLHIERAVVHDGPGRPLIVKTTKTHADRIRRIGPNATVVLAEHLAAMDARAAGAGVRISKHAYVFSKRADCSEPWQPDTVTTYFVTIRNALAKIDPTIKAVRLHDLRHFKITEEIDAGIPLPTVAEGAGHANSATTARIYAHATEPSSKLAAEVADDLFG